MYPPPGSLGDIYEKDRRLYADIASGKIKIKTAYQQLYKPKQIHKKRAGNKPFDFNDLKTTLEDANAKLIELSKDDETPVSLLKEIDNELFSLRKNIGKRIIYKDSD